MLPETLRWVGQTQGHLELLDQRLLPGRTEYLRCCDVDTVFDAIRSLAVRGAPAIGVTAAYGAFIAARRGDSVDQCLSTLADGVERLRESRPTAVNLFWALDRMVKHAEQSALHVDCRDEFVEGLLTQARQIDHEDRDLCQRIGQVGWQLIEDGFGVLTHCNAGSLATSYGGTALAVIYEAHRQSKRFTVYADETRPVLQGARLTYWELDQAGVDAVLICDDMAGYAMQLGKINMVIVGADRIAANGDVANKIGTYTLAVLSARHGIPFYVAAPTSTFDMNLASGADIPIEQRDPDEVRRPAGQLTTVIDAAVWNPAFDVTPAELITGIVTDRGMIDRPCRDTIVSKILS